MAVLDEVRTAAEAAPVIELTTLLDREALGPLRSRIVLLCGLVAMLDGFDVQVIGIAAPTIAAAFHVPLRAFGLVFGATLLGLAIGAASFGALSDRIGRRPVLIAATCMFGVFTLATAAATSFPELLVVRCLAGLGLGGAMPSFIGIVSDYVPRRRRKGLVALLWTGFPAGGMLAGTLAPPLVVAFGWPSLFYAGGLAPLALAGVIAAAVPESPLVLMRRGARQGEIRRLVRRMWPRDPLPPHARLVAGHDEPDAASMRLLFAEGRAGMTLLLWVAFFATFLLLITCAIWVPALLQMDGLGIGGAAAVLIAFNLGSVAGTPVAGLLLGAAGPKRALWMVFVACAGLLALAGQVTWSAALLRLDQALSGLCLGAGSSALIALAAQAYPAAIRSTGLGCAMALGRLGSFAGPVAVGGLVAWDWSAGGIFAAFALPAAVAATCAALLGRRAGTTGHA